MEEVDDLSESWRLIKKTGEIVERIEQTREEEQALKVRFA